MLSALQAHKYTVEHVQHPPTHPIDATKRLICLCRGRIRVSYDVGNNPVSTMFSYEILNDGKYHTVQLLSVMKNFTLVVDGGMARSIVNEGDNDYLKVHTSMYLAGLSETKGEKALKLWHLRNATSFNGA